MVVQVLDRGLHQFAIQLLLEFISRQCRSFMEGCAFSSRFSLEGGITAGSSGSSCAFDPLVPLVQYVESLEDRSTQHSNASSFGVISRSGALSSWL